jgi:hypothetical protein
LERRPSETSNRSVGKATSRSGETATSPNADIDHDSALLLQHRQVDRDARLSGVRVGRMKIAVYTLMGALAGLGGLLLAARLGAGDPKAGQLFELTAIAAAGSGERCSAR